MKYGLLMVTLIGCETPTAATYFYGTPLDEVTFNLHSLTMGVYPDESVIDDPNNPFASGGLDGDLRWEVTSGGLPVATFYAWATWLTYQPTGEAQFYTASALHAIYDLALCEDAELYYVRGLALDGYQSGKTDPVLGPRNKLRSRRPGPPVPGGDPALPESAPVGR